MRLSKKIISIRHVKKIAFVGLLIVTYALKKIESSSAPGAITSQKSTPVFYTKHALCRMDCRKIDSQEVQEVLQKGRLNHHKSNPKAQPCPVRALEARSSRDRQKIRVIVTDCPQRQKIITVIDLGQRHQCICP